MAARITFCCLRNRLVAKKKAIRSAWTQHCGTPRHVACFTSVRREAMVAGHLLVVALLALVAHGGMAAFAGKKAPKRGGGGGFGAAPRDKAKMSRNSPKVVPAKKKSTGSGLDAMLREQHGTNCADSTKLWATCEDGTVGKYDGGWTALAAPQISPDNAPYMTDRLILKSNAALLSATECTGLIEQMEAHGAANGWDARYPVDGFTREVNIADIPESVELLNRALRETLLPAVASEFGNFAASSLRVNEALVVKYDAATGNNCLPVHQDFSLFTINVALSQSSSFKGGGTWFQHDGKTIVAGRGEALVHAGGIPHCGVPVDRGARYQLVLFILSTAHADLSGRMQAIGAAAGAKAAKPLMDVDLSTAALERAAEINPLDAETWSQFAHNRKHAGDAAGAAAAFERVVSLSHGRDFAALCSLAAVRTSMGDDAAALGHLERALAIGAPPSPAAAAETLAAQHSAGMALLATGRHEDAGLVFEAVIEADAAAAESWAALGVCMAALGQPDAALACQRRVLLLRGVAVPAVGDPGVRRGSDGDAGVGVG